MKIEEIIEKITKELKDTHCCPECGDFKKCEFLEKIIPDLEAAEKEQDELIEENKRLKKTLRQAQVYDYDDLTDEAKKDFSRIKE